MNAGLAEFWGMVFGAGSGGESPVMKHDDAMRSAIVREFQGKDK
jgi:hypothetical protein